MSQLMRFRGSLDSAQLHCFHSLFRRMSARLRCDGGEVRRTLGAENAVLQGVEKL